MSGWRLRLALVAAGAVLAVGVSLAVVRARDDDEPRGRVRGDLAQLVLQPSDLTAAFTRFDVGRQVRADLPSGPRGDPRRFGREDGWKARYRRAGSPNTRGPLVVESRVDIFESEQGAGEDLEAHRAAESTSGSSQSLADPAIGDAAFASTILQGAAGSRVRFYLIAWRDENVTASVFVNGFDGKISLAEALALARRQQRRIED